MKIPKSTYEASDVKPAWLPSYDQRGNQRKPVIRCQCGMLIGLGAHSVDLDGTVRNSFAHTPPVAGACGFHEHLQLEGWIGTRAFPVG